MNASARDWQKLQNNLLLLLVLTFCLYLPTLNHYAFADDEIYLAYMNRFLREAPWSDLYQLFLKPQNPWEFLPLRDFTYWLDFRVFGDETSGFHATNLVWYAASALASFWFFRELVLYCQPVWTARASVLALCGVLLFAVHPAHVEVAAWIASRKDLVAGTLGLLSLAMLVRAMRCGWPWPEILVASLLLFLACFGKAAAMTNILVVTVLVGVGWRCAPEIRAVKKIGILLLFWALIAVAFLIHLKVGEATGIRIENHPGVWVMIERASRILSALLGILLFPFPLRFYYDVYQLGDWHWLISVCAVLLLFLALAVLSKRRSLWALGVVLVLSPLLIYLQLIPFTTWSLASERFIFISVAGLALVLIDSFGRLSSPKLISALVLLIVVPCAIVVWTRIDDWEYTAALHKHEYELQPDFHNVMRDRIVFKFLPEKRYDEAEVLARQLPRSYASTAYLSLLDTDRAYRQWSDARSTVQGGPDGVLRLNFCSEVARFRVAIRNGYAHIPLEPDVSYNNLLGTLDRMLKYIYGDSKWLCQGG